MKEIIFSVIVYLCTFSVSALLVYFGLKTYKKGKKIVGVLLATLGILVPSILSGIRYDVGSDYSTYVGMFENAVSSKPLYYRSIEPASAMIIKLSASMRNSVFMFSCFSLITNLCFYIAFVRLFKGEAKKTTLAYMFFLCIIYPTTLNAVRSGAAISLATLALSFLLERWSAKTITAAAAMIIIAFLFHKSITIMLLFLPAFWLMQKNIKKNAFSKKSILLAIYLLLAAFLPLLYTVVKEIIPLGDYGRYFEGVGNSFSIPLASFAMMIPIAYAGIFAHYNKSEYSDGMKKILSYSLFYIPLSIATGWLSYVKGLSRITFIFDPIIVILMAYLIGSCKNTSKFWKIATIVCISSVVGAMFVRNLIWSKDLPYKTVFQQEVSNASKD